MDAWELQPRLVGRNQKLLFMKHFVKTVKVNIEHPVLLLLDNHYSHLAIDVLDYCKDNGVVLLSFPPHCSHKLQPLDRTVFGPLKKIWGPEQQTWMRNNPSKTMTIFDRPGILRKTWPQSAVSGKIIKGFEVIGIYPFNRNIFTDVEYAPSFVTDGPNPSSAADEETTERIQAIRVRTPQVLMKLRLCQLLPPVKMMATLRNQIQE